MPFGDNPGLVLLLAAFAILAAWLFLWRRYPLEITVQDGHVTALRGVAKAQTRRVVEFLERDVALGGKVKVVGARDPQGVLRINFRGRVDEGTQQQIRNYLKMVL